MAAAVRYHANPFVVTMLNTDGSAGAWTPPAACKVIDARGWMTGAGASGDTMGITDATAAICDDVDTSALGDTDILANGLAEIDDDYRIIGTTEVLTGAPASASKTSIAVLLVWGDA